MTYYCAVYDAKYVAKCIIFYKIIQGKALIRKLTEWQSCHVKILTFFFYLFSTLCLDFYPGIVLMLSKDVYTNLKICLFVFCIFVTLINKQTQRWVAQLLLQWSSLGSRASGCLGARSSSLHSLLYIYMKKSYEYKHTHRCAHRCTNRYAQALFRGCCL